MDSGRLQIHLAATNLHHGEEATFQAEAALEEVITAEEAIIPEEAFQEAEDAVEAAEEKDTMTEKSLLQAVLIVKSKSDSSGIFNRVKLIIPFRNDHLFSNYEGLEPSNLFGSPKPLVFGTTGAPAKAAAPPKRKKRSNKSSLCSDDEDKFMAEALNW